MLFLSFSHETGFWKQDSDWNPTFHVLVLFLMSLVYHRGECRHFLENSQGYKNAAHAQAAVFHPQHHRHGRKMLRNCILKHRQMEQTYI